MSSDGRSRNVLVGRLARNEIRSIFRVRRRLEGYSTEVRLEVVEGGLEVVRPASWVPQVPWSRRLVSFVCFGILGTNQVQETRRRDSCLEPSPLQGS